MKFYQLCLIQKSFVIRKDRNSKAFLIPFRLRLNRVFSPLPCNPLMHLLKLVLNGPNSNAGSM